LLSRTFWPWVNVFILFAPLFVYVSIMDEYRRYAIVIYEYRGYICLMAFIQ
jgi:hypothetical protein